MVLGQQIKPKKKNEADTVEDQQKIISSIAKLLRLNGWYGEWMNDDDDDDSRSVLFLVSI